MGDSHPEALVQLRDEVVADAERFNVHRRQRTRKGEGMEVPPESKGSRMQEEMCQRSQEAPSVPGKRRCSVGAR
jgi:hypothetical protein